MALWTDVVSPAELTVFSRTAFEELDDSPLQEILPNVFQDEIKFTWNVGSTGTDIAKFSEFDTESTIGDAPDGEEKTARLLPVSRKVPLSEYSQLSDRENVQARAEENAGSVARAVLLRLMLARGEALETGQIKLNENGIKSTINFGRAKSLTVAEPEYGVWSESGADPISDLLDWSERISDNTRDGLIPDRLIVSPKAAAALSRSLVSAGYISATGGLASRAAVNETLAAHDLPEVTVLRQKAGGRRLISENKVILAVSGGESGGTVFGPTVEALDERYQLAGVGESGLVAGLFREDDPPVAWVMGKAVALPILSNPNATLAAKVV